MQLHQQRVVMEKDELDERLNKLKSFFGTEIFNGLDDAEKQRLRDQCNAMQDYSEILGARIAAFAG